MDMVTTVANLRSTTETRIVNDYTYRQLAHICEVYLKDKMFILDIVTKSLGTNSKKSSAAPAPSYGGLPAWFKPKATHYGVTQLDDLDDPGKRMGIKRNFDNLFSNKRRSPEDMSNRIAAILK